MTWEQNIVLVTTLDYRDARLAYAHEAFKRGWSLTELEAQIDADLRGR